MTDLKDALTQKDLQHRWGVGYRTVIRRRKAYGLAPCDYTGNQPVFEPGAVERMEERRKRALLTQGGTSGGPRIISVKEAKRLAGRGGKRGAR